MAKHMTESNIIFWQQITVDLIFGLLQGLDNIEAALCNLILDT